MHTDEQWDDMRSTSDTTLTDPSIYHSRNPSNASLAGAETACGGATILKTHRRRKWMLTLAMAAATMTFCV